MRTKKIWLYCSTLGIESEMCLLNTQFPTPFDKLSISQYYTHAHKHTITDICIPVLTHITPNWWFHILRKRDKKISYEKINSYISTLSLGSNRETCLLNAPFPLLHWVYRSSTWAHTHICILSPLYNCIVFQLFHVICERKLRNDT